MKSAGPAEASAAAATLRVEINHLACVNNASNPVGHRAERVVGDIWLRVRTSAWWELWIFTFYRQLGYTIDGHPDLPNGTNPDFLISREGVSTCVECKAIPEKPRSADEGRIIDCTNEVKHPDFLLELEIDRQGTQTPSCNAIRTRLEERLRALDADAVIGDYEAGQIFPSFQVSVQDWLLTYTAYPVDPKRRGGRGRLLALPPTPGAVLIDNVGVIRRALAAKGRK